jgi:hypothetical protein
VCFSVFIIQTHGTPFEPKTTGKMSVNMGLDVGDGHGPSHSSRLNSRGPRTGRFLSPTNVGLLPSIASGKKFDFNLEPSNSMDAPADVSSFSRPSVGPRMSLDLGFSGQPRSSVSSFGRPSSIMNASGTRTSRFFSPTNLGSLPSIASGKKFAFDLGPNDSRDASPDKRNSNFGGSRSSIFGAMKALQLRFSSIRF